MKALSALPTVSLRVKLVLSYLAVALGAILALTFIVSLAVQSYYTNLEQDLLRTQARYKAEQVEHIYRELGGSWNGVRPAQVQTDSPFLLALVDMNGKLLLQSAPAYLRLNDSEMTIINEALNRALQGQEVNGRLQGLDNNTFSGLYISVPLRYDQQSGSPIIGAMLLAEPEIYPQGFSPNEFLAHVNQAILLTGLIVSLIVVLVSLLLTRRLTRPLESLTIAAEQMKGGNYTQRVTPPQSGDELERLALSFNAMADRIESDVTELRRQEQMRRDLLANIAHDLATPLTAIQGFSEALADDVISDPNARLETAQLIGREVQRLRRLVGDMQQMTALESGRAQLDLAPLDLQVQVDETLAVIQPECDAAGITLRNAIAPTAPPVLADSDRITQVLLNLLDNARRHTPSGGTITIGAKPQGNRLLIWVNDTGVGIDPADLPHIFERFYRADRARTGSAGSSGLGLSIVKATITAHGGNIWAESTPGKGTCILFTLPLAT
jgi:signal transduction histidine kinase